MMDDEEEVEAASRFIGPSLEAFEEYSKHQYGTVNLPCTVRNVFDQNICK